jgi:NAD(P)-dependent dehydrogenase (short-subunit alcohol dehydrogenase family)
MVMKMSNIKGGVMGRIEGKVAVVTGGALGLGKATCQVLAKEGATVAVTDIRPEEGQQLAEEMESSGGSAHFWELDTSSEDKLERFLPRFATPSGR